MPNTDKGLKMSTRMMYSSMVVWLAMVTGLIVVALFAHIDVGLITSGFALAVGLMPPAMMLRWRVPAAIARSRRS